ARPRNPMKPPEPPAPKIPFSGNANVDETPTIALCQITCARREFKVSYQLVNNRGFCVTYQTRWPDSCQISGRGSVPAPTRGSIFGSRGNVNRIRVEIRSP